MGIPKESGIGVSTADIRRLARETGRSDELAFELWKRIPWKQGFWRYFFEKKQLSAADIERLMEDVKSWDLCDHMCKNLIIKRNDYHQFIMKWIHSPRTYEKRAAFTLIASAAIHDKGISDETLDDYLNLIRENSQDEQEHIKKSVSVGIKRDWEEGFYL